MSKTNLRQCHTSFLGDCLQTSLSPMLGKTYKCELCDKRATTLELCEFCLANELYTRRKTMAFMRLDLCVQAAVCLIAKNEQKSTVKSNHESISKSLTQTYDEWRETNKVYRTYSSQPMGQFNGDCDDED